MGLSFWDHTAEISRAFFRQRDDGNWDFFPASAAGIG
jgi:hypothetical protein